VTPADEAGDVAIMSGGEPLDRFRGCLLGLAVGDALGTALEFSPPGTFAPIHDIVGGGPFDLKPGEWTDDTSMALCLAESLIEKRGFDPIDQLERYLRWRDEGCCSATGHADTEHGLCPALRGRARAPAAPTGSAGNG
jgi:ADP-ribosylglycohydrolase